MAIKENLTSYLAVGFMEHEPDYQESVRTGLGGSVDPSGL